MHNFGFQQMSLPHVYDIYECGDAAKVNEVIRTKNFGGASVTIPLKLDMLPFMDELSTSVQKIGAMNTIYFNTDGQLVGENTDWIGILQSIQSRLHSNSRKYSALIVGAGGTARAACYAMQQLNTTIYVYNRTYENAQLVAKDFNATAIENATSLPSNVDIVIGTVPASAKFTLPDHVLSSSSIVLDAAYIPAMTCLLQQAHTLQCSCIQGAEMLVRQAVAQFKLWTNTNPATNGFAIACYNKIPTEEQLPTPLLP